MNDEDRHKIACHEAAHALTAYLLRIPIDEVCIGTDGSGYMSDDGPAPSLDEGRSPFDVGYAHAVVAAAPIAVGAQMSEGDHVFFDRAMWLCSVDVPRDILLLEAVRKAAKLILANRDKLDCLVDALVVRGKYPAPKLRDCSHEDIARRLSRGFILPHAVPPPLAAIEAAKKAGASEAVVLILETRAKRLGHITTKAGKEAE